MQSFNQDQYITRISEHLVAESLDEISATQTINTDALGNLNISEATGTLKVASGDFALGDGSETVFTSFEGSRLSLGAGDDTVVVLGDSQVLLGAGQDTVVVAPARAVTGSTHVVVHDFDSDNDRIDLSMLGVQSLTDLIVTATGDGVRVVLPDGTRLTLNGDVSVASLTADHFSFTEQFQFGVASGDPDANSVVLWTQVSTRDKSETVRWEIASDREFTDIIDSGSTITSADSSHTVKVIAAGLDAGTDYFYRFTVDGDQSSIGRTKTLPEAGVESVNLAVVSCANFERGYFNPYQEIANGEYDAIIHLGDYIYEYDTRGYTNADQTYTRTQTPYDEIVSLDQYRERYATYHTDESLVAARESAPLIAIWDDHETANNSFAAGADNHDAGEGDWDVRVDNALTAYYEWLPIREPESGDRKDADRTFEFGDLVDVHMLETRLQARSEELKLPSAVDVETRIGAIVSDEATTVAYATALGVAPTDAGFQDALVTAVSAELLEERLIEAATGDRTMLGHAQLAELGTKVEASDALWHVLGSPTQMARLDLPVPYLQAFAEALAAVAAGQAPDVSFVEPYQVAAVQAAAGDPTALTALLADPKMPESFDNWGGFGLEREQILTAANTMELNLLSIAGDSHNSWAGQLTLNDGTVVGHEFAAPGISAPGYDQVNQLLDVASVDDLYPILIDDINYTDFTSKGFLDLSINRTEAIGTFRYVDTVFSETYTPFESDPVTVTLAGQMNL